MSIMDRVKPNILREIGFILLSLLIIVVSIYLDHIGFCSLESWFQRGGSILVVVGALSESKHIQKIPAEGLINIDSSNKFKFVHHSGFIIAILGTLIWGFGDLF